MTSEVKELASLDRTIHEPARLMIVTVLYAVTEADFLYLQRECGLTQGNLSSHLSKLEDARYVLIEKTFKGKYPLTICSLTRKGREAFEQYLRTIRAVSENAGHERRRPKKARPRKESPAEGCDSKLSRIFSSPATVHGGPDSTRGKARL